MRGGRKKFYADALPLLGEVADKNYAALLLLFGNRVDQYNVRAQFHFGLHVKQRAMSVHDDSLAVLTEFAAYGGLPCGTHGNASKDAGATTSRRTGRCGVHEPIVRPTVVRVNSTFAIRCPKCSRFKSATGMAGNGGLAMDVSELVRRAAPAGCLKSNDEIWKQCKPVPLAVLRRTSVE